MSWNPLRGMPTPATTSGGTVAYPFSAIVGADAAKLALLLHAVNPRLGGVLLVGPVGSGKTTLAHATAAVLPPTRVVAGCRFLCEHGSPDPTCPDGPHDTQIGYRRAATLVQVPVAAQLPEIAATPPNPDTTDPGGGDAGALAAAHRGVLLFQQITEYAEPTLARAVSAATTGRVTFGRTGAHALDTVIVGTATPAALARHPHLADRFSIRVATDLGARDDLRADVIHHRLEYDVDPSAVYGRYATADAELTRRIVEARARWRDVTLCGTAAASIVAACMDRGLSGSRADVAVARVALTHAAWAGRIAVMADDVAVATALTLTPWDEAPEMPVKTGTHQSPTGGVASAPAGHEPVIDIRDDYGAPAETGSVSPTTTGAPAHESTRHHGEASASGGAVLAPAPPTPSPVTQQATTAPVIETPDAHLAEAKAHPAPSVVAGLAHVPAVSPAPGPHAPEPPASDHRVAQVAAPELFAASAEPETVQLQIVPAATLPGAPATPQMGQIGTLGGGPVEVASAASASVDTEPLPLVAASHIVNTPKIGPAAAASNAPGSVATTGHVLRDAVPSPSPGDTGASRGTGVRRDGAHDSAPAQSGDAATANRDASSGPGTNAQVGGVSNSQSQSTVTWEWTPSAPDMSGDVAAGSSQPGVAAGSENVCEPLFEPTVWPEPDDELSSVDLPSGDQQAMKQRLTGIESWTDAGAAAGAAAWAAVTRGTQTGATRVVRCIDSSGTIQAAAAFDVVGGLLGGGVTKDAAATHQSVASWAEATGVGAAWLQLRLPLVTAGLAVVPAGNQVSEPHLAAAAPLVVFGVDTSGMGGAAARLVLAGDAMAHLLQPGDAPAVRVALVTFYGADAHVTVPPTASVAQVRSGVAAVTTGGRAPLAEGIVEIIDLVRGTEMSGPTVAVLVTDGRATYGDDAVARSRDAVQALADAVTEVVVVDCEEDQPGRLRLRLAERLAELAGAPVLSLGDVTAATVAAAAQEATGQTS